MPFSLTNAPTTFMRYMDYIIDDILMVRDAYMVSDAYLDDILIFSRSSEEHVR